jgi:hypothetical protein
LVDVCAGSARSRRTEASWAPLDDAAIKAKVKKEQAGKSKKPSGPVNMQKDRKKQNIKATIKAKGEWF